MYKYQIISRKLREKFTDGTYQPGDLLPDQNELAKEFNTTRMTVRKAIQWLIVEGIVYTKRGSGTFLRKDYHKKAKNDLDSSVDRPIGATLTYAGHKVTSKVLSIDARLPTKDEQNELFITPEEPVYVIKRVRYVDNKVYAFEHTIMPTRITKITKEILEGSIYKHLADNEHIHIAGSHRRIHAIKATQEDVEAMGVTLNDPVLAINQISYTEEGEPFEKSEEHFPYESSSVIADVDLSDTGYQRK